jgi:predicted nucleic acid-binding protein
MKLYDTLHVAMARILGAELATFDGDQATAAKAEGIVTHTERG